MIINNYNSISINNIGISLVIDMLKNVIAYNYTMVLNILIPYKHGGRGSNA